MDLLVRAFPVLEGREEALTEFTRELAGARAGETREFYGRYGIARETWHAQRADGRTWVICVTHMPDQPVEEAGEVYAASANEFDQWFKRQVERLTGVDPDKQPLGPPSECIFDTRSVAADG